MCIMVFGVEQINLVCSILQKPFHARRATSLVKLEPVVQSDCQVPDEIGKSDDEFSTAPERTVFHVYEMTYCSIVGRDSMLKSGVWLSNMDFADDEWLK